MYLCTMEKLYRLPVICWLRVTDYMQGWVQNELGGEAKAYGQRVVSVQHLPGARNVMRMETNEETMAPRQVGIAMSATLRNCIDAGLILDAEAVERMYGITKEALALFVPVECPRLALTKNGVLRPWTNDVCFGRTQARAMEKLLFREFWKAVAEFDKEYAEKMNGKKYPAKDMVEAFCDISGTYSYHVDTIRREWMRQREKIGKIREL